MRGSEKTAVGVAVVAGVLLCLLLEITFVEAETAKRLFVQADTTGREEAAAGFLMVAAVYRSLQILVLALTVGSLAAGVMLSKLLRRDGPE